MANWDATANQDFMEIKRQTQSTDGQMQGLKGQIDAWANANPNGSTVVPFGRFRNHGVRATTSGGWITRVSYGDRP